MPEKPYNYARVDNHSFVILMKIISPLPHAYLLTWEFNAEHALYFPRRLKNILFKVDFTEIFCQCFAGNHRINGRLEAQHVGVKLRIIKLS